MDDRPTGLTSGLRAAPVTGLKRGRGLGLSWKLLLLTVLFVMVSEVLIYVPSVASFRRTWLHDRVTMADAASLVLAASDNSDVPRDIQDELLSSVGAKAIAIRTGDVSR